MWSKVGKVNEHKDELKLMPQNFGTYESKDVESFSRNLHISADCNKAIKGFFTGVCFFVFALVGMMVYIMFSSVCSESREDQNGQIQACLQGPILNNSIEIVLLTIMLVTTIMVYYSFSLLDVNNYSVSFLDNSLLLVCLPAYLLYGIFNAIADAETMEEPHGRLAFGVNLVMVRAFDLI